MPIVTRRRPDHPFAFNHAAYGHAVLLRLWSRGAATPTVTRCCYACGHALLLRLRSRGAAAPTVTRCCYAYGHAVLLRLWSCGRIWTMAGSLWQSHMAILLHMLNSERPGPSLPTVTRPAVKRGLVMPTVMQLMARHMAITTYGHKEGPRPPLQTLASGHTGKSCDRMMH